MDAQCRIGAEALRQWSAALLERQGVAPADAQQAAAMLVRSSLRGIDTHGISRLPAYVAQLASGELNAAARPMVASRAGFLHCDGERGLGPVVASIAMTHAMERASEAGFVACTIEATGHLAALGGYVLAAAERGFFALLCQRTPPVMAMPGASAPVIGNNPLAFAVPLAHRPPLVFDMAHSVVARGQVAQALREGRSEIPDDWAIGPDGQPTTDPALALQGAMRPIAGHKGIGLAMLVECLAGSLSGATATPASAAARASGSVANVSTFLLVADPARVVGRAAFDDSVEAWLQTYLAHAGPGARYPGERQARCEQERSQTGIPLPPGLLDELRQLGARHGLRFDPGGGAEPAIRKATAPRAAPSGLEAASALSGAEAPPPSPAARPETAP